MRELAVELFDVTSDYTELRFFDGEGQPRTRGLDRADIDALIQSVDTHYGRGAVPTKVFDAPELVELGRSLFRLLDGEERWLADVLGRPPGATLRIDAGERLRHLPWELLATTDGGQLAVDSLVPFTPVRSASSNVAIPAGTPPANRPLRVLFMATSPEGVEPVLAFETEEALILQATLRSGGTELVVEESGTLAGLKFMIESYGPSYFDVIHLNGHADVADTGPVFLAEDEVGAMSLATPDDIAQAVGGGWPRLVFVSGCLTGAAPDAGTIPSMSERLVQAGAPAVLGWALPVGDIAASKFASFLYRELAVGHRLDEAVARARQQLHAARSPNWHLLRLYADGSDLLPMVTEQHHPGRARLQVHHAAAAFLDPQTQQSRVADRQDFVGRRRVIQRCLRALKEPIGSPDAVEGLVLQGMGGLGKSTLASRLLERMPRHQRIVYFGRVDDIVFSRQLSAIDLSLEEREALNQILAAPDLDLESRLRMVLNGPLATVPCLFVFDDFEDGNLDDVDADPRLSPDMVGILGPLLRAIRAANTESRVIITSRYRFPAPTGSRMQVEQLETFNDVEQGKKLLGLPNLRADAITPAPIRTRAIDTAAGNPRLLEWLDKIVNDPHLDVDALIARIEGEADRFRREDILAEALLDTQTDELVDMLARVNVIELPVPIEAVHALHDHPDAQTHISRATTLGLLEEGTDPTDGTHRYYVSNVLGPLLRPRLTEEAHREACATAARALYDLWHVQPADDNPPPST